MGVFDDNDDDDDESVGQGSVAIRHESRQLPLNAMTDKIPPFESLPGRLGWASVHSDTQYAGYTHESMCTVLRLKRTSYAFQRQPNSDGDGGSGGVQKREQRYFLSDLQRRTVIVKDCCDPGSHYYQ